MSRALSKTASPSISMRPRSGRRIPAIALTTDVLPAPEGPNSAVTPSPASKAAFSRKTPRRRSMASLRVIARDPAGGTVYQHLRREQGRQRERNRNERHAQGLRVARRRLRIGVDGERQGAGLAGNIRYESNGRTEFAESARKREQH